MKFLKFKKVALTFLLAFMSMFAVANASANQVKEMFQIESCASLKDGFRAVTIKANSPNANTDGLKFNYLDALECNTAILDKNIFTKVSYIIFGEPSIYATEVATTIIRTGFGFDDIKPSVFTGKFKAAMIAQGVEPMTSTVVTTSAISEAMMAFSLVLLITFIIFYIYNSASDGEALGQGASFAWIAARIGISITLIVPIDHFGGFSAIQIIVLVVASLGNLLANVVAFMLPLFEFLDKTDLEKVEFDNSPSSFSSISEMVDESVKSHICDIQKRKSILFMSGTDSKAVRSVVESDELYQCIQEETIFDEFKEKSSTKTRGTGFFKSKHLVLTESCAISAPTKRINIQCSNNTYDVPLDAAREHNKEKLFILTENDETFRSIAKDTIKLYCSDILDGFNFSLTQDILTCADFDGVNVNYETRGDNDYVAMIGKQDESLAGKILKDTTDVKTKIYTNMVNNVKSDLFDNIVNDKTDILEEKLGFSLMKGWMSTASFMLESGQNIKDINNSYISEFTRFNLSEGAGGMFVSSKFGTIRANQVYRSFTLPSHDSIYNLYLRNTEPSKIAMNFKLVDGGDRENLLKQDEFESSLIMRIFFPGIKKIKELSGGKILSDKSYDDSCINEFNKCRSVGVNPLKDVIEMGSDMMTTGLMVSAGSNAVSFLLGKLVSVSGSTTFAFGADLASLVGSMFLIYMILGAALVYMPSILIFAYFLGNAIGWLSNVLVFSSISILWVVMHFFPDRNKGFAGKASYGYTKLLDIMLRPTFVVFGVFVTYIITSIMLAMLNVLFAMTINTFELFNSPNSFMDFVMNYIVYLVYVVLIIVVLWRSIKSIYKVPNALMEWFNMENDENADVWNEMGDYFTYNVTSVLLNR